jgi:hypothetical protein
MTIDEFWDIVDRVHRASGGDMDRKCQLLQEDLEKLSIDEIYSFDSHFDDCDDKAYAWDLWAAAYIIGGGCSDDSFSDFRATLISMGRETFEKVVTLPDSLADMEYEKYDSFYEGYQYIPMNAFIDMTGGELPGRAKPSPSHPSGEKWDDADLPYRCPKVWQKHGWTKN